MSIKSMILAACDLKRQAVEVPEWKNTETGKPITVYVSVMSGADRAAWNKEAFDADGKIIQDGMEARLLVYSLRDENGKKLFTADEIAELNDKSPDVLERLFSIAIKVSGLGKSAVEDAEKN